MAYKSPKGITHHRVDDQICVEKCSSGKSKSFIDYKYDVSLKSGWLFTNGRFANCERGRFNTVLEFELAFPTEFGKWEAKKRFVGWWTVAESRS